MIETRKILIYFYNFNGATRGVFKYPINISIQGTLHFLRKHVLEYCILFCTILNVLTNNPVHCRVTETLHIVFECHSVIFAYISVEAPMSTAFEICKLE